ncbi:MAG: GDYXXLXY domain-containing protein, partial [Bacteroidota bacterium]
IDPTDPFRGKYITLSYDENSIEISDAENWVSGESIYVALGTDKEGIARIESVSRARPTDGADFIEAQVWYVSESDPRRLMIDYPFDRYYMEESKAQEAEDTHRRAQRDTTRITYALVSVKNGDAVVKDILIDGISISEIVKANREGAKE